MVTTGVLMGAAPPSSPFSSPHSAAQKLRDRAYKIAYTASRDRKFSRWPSLDELGVRLNGYARKLYGAAAPAYPTILEMCEVALARIIRRGRQLTFGEFEAWKSDKSREKGIRSGRARRARTADRDARIRDAFAGGASATALAREHGISRQQVYNIVKRDGGVKRTISHTHTDDSHSNYHHLMNHSSIPKGGDCSLDTRPFPAPDVPPEDRWPAWQFELQTGLTIDVATARHLVDLGRCATAEGRQSVNDLMRIIAKAAANARWSPLAYVETAWRNRGDAWTIDAELLGEVMRWCGEKALDYAMRTIAGGYVERPMPYLRAALEEAKDSGRPPAGYDIDKPVALGVLTVKRWLPALQVTGADEAISQEEEKHRRRHLDSYVRMHGCLPWDKLEQPENPPESPDPARIAATESRGEAPKPAEPTHSPLELQPPRRKIEQGPCRHEMTGVLMASMDLDLMVQVDCADGCGHRLYSDRGPIPCPCCRPRAAKTAALLTR